MRPDVADNGALLKSLQMGSYLFVNQLLVTELLLHLLLCTGQISAASFYGDGYVHLRMVEQSSRTSLHVRFWTSSQSGLLFLAAGHRDFLLLELTSGRLQVRLELGSGERSLLSEKGVNLSDRAWHSMVLHHDRHNVTMTVDRHSHTSLRMPGPDLELSIQDGLFVGGSAGLNHPYLLPSFGHNSTGFRGCVDEVVFNEHNLLSSLKPYSGYKSVHEVSLGCSAQFSSTEEDPISFFSSKAFLVLPTWDVLQEGVFECDLQPSSGMGDGLVLYSSAHRGGFVAVEIRDSRVVAAVGSRGGSKTELHSHTRLHSNHSWYPVRLHLLPHSVQLKVGEEMIDASLGPELQVLQLRGPLYLGGLDEQAGGEAKQAGLLSAGAGGRLVEGGVSFKGCLREIRLNTQTTGLLHATVTKDVSVGCQTERVPEDVADTSSTDHTHSDITTQQPISNNGPDRKKNHSFLFLRDLEVAEGRRAPLEPRHIKVNLAFRKLRIRPSQLMFRIEEQPIHGHLRLDLASNHSRTRGGEEEEGKLREGLDEEEEEEEEEEWTFSMLDLWQGRVMYVHGGSEDRHDFFMFSVRLSGSKRQLPVFLKGNRMHRFNISVSPVNDAPELSLPGGSLFVLLENSKRQLTTDLLRVSDPDSSAADLVFNALGNTNSEAGHLEHQEHPGRAISSFSLPDLEEGKVSFVHTGVTTSRLALRVSDGQKVSNTVVLRIMAVALEHKLANNTGLVVDQGGASVITTNHLAVQINVPNQAVEIRYDITEVPQYGELQRLLSTGEWKPTGYFPQKLLEKEQIRYLSTYHGLQTKSNVTDQFKCKISIGSAATEEVVFHITVRWIHFKVTRSKMEVSGVRKAVVTSDDLHGVSKGVKLNESDLYFRLLTLPQKGHLVLNQKVLKRNSTFSQKNITDRLVKYELFNKPHENTRDTLSFQLFSKHANSSSHDFRISIKAESNTVTLVNKGLSILEGESKVITKEVLFIQTGSNKAVQYTITTSPRHGQIRRINLSNSTSINDNIVTFTNQDILEERIMYVHDDSETKQDSFTFHAVVYKPHKHATTKEDKNTMEHTFYIKIQLVNDQRPVRVVNKVFHVARDGQKLLTLDDLRYRDDDSDFEDGWLAYTRRGIPMGELVLVSDTSHKLYEFTQRDLEQRKVLFIHRGVSFGRFVLFVSDGKHYVSALLEVKAQDPYMQVENNTGLQLQKGGVTTLTSANLSVVTNLDVRDPQEVTYELFLPPKHGFLLLDGGDGGGTTAATDAISKFTQQDLIAGRVAYRHDDSPEMSDFFNVTVRARERRRQGLMEGGRGEVHVDIGVAVKVYLESHQRAPTVLSNSPVVVEEGQYVAISRGHLEVVHEDSQPSEIVFSIQSPPYLGSLRRGSPAEEAEDKHEDLHHDFHFQRPPSLSVLRRFSPGEEYGDHQHHDRYQVLKSAVKETITSFTQEEVNLGLILYQHQDPGSTNDSFLLDATNGVTEIGPIKVEIDVIPILIPLKVSNIILDEGSSVQLTSDIIKVTNRHLSGLNFLYQVTTPARHGHLEHSKIPGMPISAFTHKEVEHEFISYVHDGSDTLSDNFTIVANQTEIRKHSLPCAVHIDITPVNDESPVLTVNRVLRVLVGSVTEITVDDLRAEDLDTEPEGLEFIVTPPSNGYLALKSAPSRHILNFTQNHIQTGQLVFVHSGVLSGGFLFQVNDGVNLSPRQIFSTVAHSLVLILQRNQALEVYPGSVSPISPQELQVITNDAGGIGGNRTVAFAVTTPPKLGRLVRRLADNSTRHVSTFTQSMVNDGVIWYEHNHSQAVGWSATDSFSFTVSCPPAFLPPHTFTIFISYKYSDDKHHHHHHLPSTKLLANTGVVVAEGGTVMIDRTKLDASNLLVKIPERDRRSHQVLYHVTSLPRHGVLSITEHNLTSAKRDFSQQALDSFGLIYVHDGSETTSDNFTFRTWVAPINTSSSSSFPSSSSFSSSLSTLPPWSSDMSHRRHLEDSLVVTEMFNITVTPVDDHPPLIKSRVPSLKVVVGETVVLGPESLQVEDHDTAPEELHYSVISKPNNGYLTLGERPEPVVSFTQYDVNHGRLHFVQQGEASTGVFYFNLTDGYHGPLYKLFSIEVTEAAVSLVNNTGLSVVQGRTTVVLTTNQLAAQTNSHRHANITYTITTPPRNGRIAIDDNEVTAFRHEDLQSGHMVYHMTDLSESEDRFEISVSASSPGVTYGNLTGQEVNVTVQPLIHLREQVRVPSGVAVKLGKGMMDATELARISRADPVFEVLSPPKHGKLVWMAYDLDGASEVVTSFTFRDVVQGRVAIEETLSYNSSDDHHGNKTAVAIAPGNAPARPLNDSFLFLLRAGDVQPAKGELHFTILPHHQMHHGHSSSSKAESLVCEPTTTKAQGKNRTTAEGGRRGGKGGSTTDGGTGVVSHILSYKNHSRTHGRSKPRHRSTNHTRSGGAAAVGGQKTAVPKPRTPSTQEEHGPEDHPNSHGPPVYVEVVPRPAADPLLIILPFLACLLLIIILIVLILVFRHRREKRARVRLIQELASASLPAEGSPYLGRPEQSMAMPSVVVTPLGPSSCPSSPMVAPGPRTRGLTPGAAVWWTPEAEGGDGSDGGGGGVGGISSANAVTAGLRAKQRSRTPTLRDDQYWV